MCHSSGPMPLQLKSVRLILHLFTIFSSSLLLVKAAQVSDTHNEESTARIGETLNDQVYESSYGEGLTSDFDKSNLKEHSQSDDHDRPSQRHRKTKLRLFGGNDLVVEEDEFSTLNIVGEIDDESLPSFPNPIFNSDNEFDNSAGSTLPSVTRRMIIRYKSEARQQFQANVQQMVEIKKKEDELLVSSVKGKGAFAGSGEAQRLKLKNDDNIDQEDRGGRDLQIGGFKGKGFDGSQPRRKAEVIYEFEEVNSVVMTLTNMELDELKVASSDMIDLMEEDVWRMPFFDPVLDEDDSASNNLRMSDKDSTMNHVSASENESSKLRRRKLDSVPYGLQTVQAPQLWNKGLDGTGVKICVIDSGIDRQHKEFQNQNINGANDNLNWDEDGCKHGSHVAGVIAAEQGSGGVTGIAFNAELFIVRVFANNCGWTYSSNLMHAAKRCKNNGASIINMSLGGGGYSSTERDYFESIVGGTDGTLCVAAAGNNGSTQKSYPASYSACISVAAVNSNNDIASWSQRNDEVDISAPGVSVKSVRANENNIENTLSYSGTSMATPHVTGIAALLKQGFPNKDWTTIRGAMESEAFDRGSTGRDNTYGHGVLKGLQAWNCLNNSNTCSGSDGGDDGGGSDECKDNPDGWYDADGPKYNCEWYGVGSRCQVFGDDYSNLGKTANEACCLCGGGTK